MAKLPHHFRHRRIRHAQATAHLRRRKALRHHRCHRVGVARGLRRASQAHPTSLGGGDACVHALGDDLALELRDGCEDVNLQHRCGVGIARVDPLRGAHEGNPVGLKFGDQLGEVGKRTGEAI